eukprot:TRINITY_DN54941_c0_g1_i1.p1 TRINITY_DN54941_c0_g1~~TRINITY_DN54941_c0_g1_i1.p1  ORF type:complete len:404 (-),score=39.34 TRINITY_DN54941_c0_g1_i1:551-1762(-)
MPWRRRQLGTFWVSLVTALVLCFCGRSLHDTPSAVHATCLPPAFARRPLSAARAVQGSRRDVLLATATPVAVLAAYPPPAIAVDQNGACDVVQLPTVPFSAGQNLDQTSLEDYAAMRDDVDRTDAYIAAIGRRLKGSSGSVVVDIGTGPFALLAIAAAKAGARRVFAIERTPSVAAEAKGAVKAAGLEEIITVIEGNSQTVKLPERADLLVSELVGNIATAEGVVDTIRDARRRFLKEGLAADPGSMIPARCQTAVAPISYVNHELLGAKGPQFLKPFKLFSETKDLVFLSPAQVLEDFNLVSPSGPGTDDLSEIQKLSFDIPEQKAAQATGLFSGFALWPRIVVDDTAVVDIQGRPSHWSYIVVLTQPRRIRLGARRTVSLTTRVDLSGVPYRYDLSAEVAC